MCDVFVDVVFVFVVCEDENDVCEVRCGCGMRSGTRDDDSSDDSSDSSDDDDVMKEVLVKDLM